MHNIPCTDECWIGKFSKNESDNKQRKKESNSGEDGQVSGVKRNETKVHPGSLAQVMRHHIKFGIVYVGSLSEELCHERVCGRFFVRGTGTALLRGGAATRIARTAAKRMKKRSPKRVALAIEQREIHQFVLHGRVVHWKRFGNELQLLELRDGYSRLLDRLANERQPVAVAKRFEVEHIGERPRANCVMIDIFLLKANVLRTFTHCLFVGTYHKVVVFGPKAFRATAPVGFPSVEFSNDDAALAQFLLDLLPDIGASVCRPAATATRSTSARGAGLRWEH